MSSPVVSPLSTIGILGGGQLGRMLALAAANLGFRVHIYAPEHDSPAFDVTRFFTCAEYDDMSELQHFAAQCDVVTYEFENIPLSTVEYLESLKPVFPQSSALKIAQDRLTEKAFAQDVGMKVSPYIAITTVEDCTQTSNITFPAVLKTARMGYDGKGQCKVASHDGLREAFIELGAVPCILEQFVNFEAELSIIAARNCNGDIKIYDLVENIHRNHILFCSKVPTAYAVSLNDQAKVQIENLLSQLKYVGVLAVEFFAVKGENQQLELYFNEMAPRVHNSGHWTMKATHTCQFEQHIRAIASWPLGNTARYAELEMRNLLGAEASNWQDYAAQSNVNLTLYGKNKVIEGRKMGHYIIVQPE